MWQRESSDPLLVCELLKAEIELGTNEIKWNKKKKYSKLKKEGVNHLKLPVLYFYANKVKILN
jgi:hypothetical protein